MNRKYLLLAGAGVVTLIVIASCAHMNGGEKMMALEQTPPAVQAAIGKTLGGQKIDKIVVEQDEGKATYEAVYHVNGQERTAEFSATGELIEQESDLEVSSLPAAVSGAIKQKYPTASITEAAEVNADGQRYYEAGVKLSDGKEREVQVNPDGTIRADKEEAGEKD